MEITQEKYAGFDRDFFPVPMVVQDFIQVHKPDADSKRGKRDHVSGKKLVKISRKRYD